MAFAPAPPYARREVEASLQAGLHDGPEGIRLYALSDLRCQSAPSCQGPVMAKVIPGLWMLQNSQSPSGL
jgi:hypothetical protein